MHLTASAFTPATVTVAPGTSVTWVNHDQAAHTVTAQPAGPDSGMLLPQSSYAFTFGATGTYAYVCTFHPGMAGEVVVAAPAPAAAEPPAPSAPEPAAPAPPAAPGAASATHASPHWSPSPGPAAVRHAAAADGGTRGLAALVAGGVILALVVVAVMALAAGRKRSA